MGLIYRPNTEPRADIDRFSSTLFDIMDIINTENKVCVIIGDMNIDLLKFGSHTKTSDYLDTIFPYVFASNYKTHKDYQLVGNINRSHLY